MRANDTSPQAAQHRITLAITSYDGATGGFAVNGQGKQCQRQGWQTAQRQHSKFGSYSVASASVAEMTASTKATAMAHNSQAAPARATSESVL